MCLCLAGLPSAFKYSVTSYHESAGSFLLWNCSTLEFTWSCPWSAVDSVFDTQLQLLCLASFDVKNDAVRLIWAVLEIVEGQTAILSSYMVDFPSLLPCWEPWRDLKTEWD